VSIGGTVEAHHPRPYLTAEPTAIEDDDGPPCPGGRSCQTPAAFDPSRG